MNTDTAVTTPALAAPNTATAGTTPTLREHVADFLARRAAAGRPLDESQADHMERDLVGAMGDARIGDLTPQDMDAFASDLAARGASALRIGILNVRAVMRDAAERGLIGPSPADMLEIPGSPSHNRILSNNETTRVMEAARDMGGSAGAFVETMLRTLKRKGEVAGMSWEDLDLRDGVWHLPLGASDRRADVVLPPQVIDIVLSQQPDEALRTGKVFHAGRRTTTFDFGAIEKSILDGHVACRVDLADERDGTTTAFDLWTLQDLRTTGAATMEERPLSVPPSTIDAVLLHRPPNKGTGKIHPLPTLENVGEALGKWNDHLDDLLASAEAWPGGRRLPPLGRADVARRIQRLRAGWRKRDRQ